MSSQGYEEVLWVQLSVVWEHTLRYVIKQLNLGRGTIRPLDANMVTAYFQPDPLDKNLHIQLRNVSGMWLYLDRKDVPIVGTDPDTKA